jgi:hypothetical protein
MGKAAQKILKNIRATRDAIQASGADAVTVHVPVSKNVNGTTYG